MFLKSKPCFCGLVLLSLSCCKKQAEEVAINPYEAITKTIEVETSDAFEGDYCLYPYRTLALSFVYTDTTEPNAVFILDSVDTITSALFNSEGNHFIRILRPSGTLIKEHFFRISTCQPILYIANTFNPNGDARNETWAPICDSINGIPAFSSMYFEIRDYDHQLVYRSKDFNQPWKGYGWPTGIYYYYVKAVDWWGKETERSGKLFRAG